ncbi:hypothetical protein V7968_02335 [Nocardia vulneris]|uniref:hypothetical protein n=1 Tax=Nocardia vulneris TaxID=1141657 RepID=UPI0030CE4D76
MSTVAVGEWAQNFPFAISRSPPDNLRTVDAVVTGPALAVVAKGFSAVHTQSRSSVCAEPVTEWSELALNICDRDSAGRRNRKEVADILALHFADGWNATRIAAQICRSRSTASRVCGMPSG